MSTPASSFAWRRIVLPVYLPTLLFAIGEGAVIPIIPILATERDASLAVAGLVTSMLMVGRLIGDLPAGALVARVGERVAMIGAAFFSAAALVLAIVVDDVIALAAGVLLLGVATAVFGLARHAFLTTFVPIPVRARTLSTLAGVVRGGWAIGPFATAALLLVTGATEAGFAVSIAMSLLVVAVLVFLPDPERVFGATRQTDATAIAASAADTGAIEAVGDADADADGTDGDTVEQRPRHTGVFRTIVQHRGVLAKVGSGAAILSALRASRTVILPLWAVSIGVPAETAAVVIGISMTIDFALFYAGGAIMDRWGRLWSAIPGLIGLSVGHLVLAVTHDLSAATLWFAFVAVLFGVANGITSGVLMTIAADLAPQSAPAPFLAAFRTITDAGNAGAPLVLAVVTSIASIMAASATIGVLGFVGVAMLLRWLPAHPHR